MPPRSFCCNELPPKGLAFSMGTIAILVGLGTLALGCDWLSLDSEWVRAPRWMVMGAGFVFIFGGIVIPLIALPPQRRERSHQS